MKQFSALGILLLSTGAQAGPSYVAYNVKCVCSQYKPVEDSDGRVTFKTEHFTPFSSVPKRKYLGLVTDDPQSFDNTYYVEDQRWVSEIKKTGKLRAGQQNMWSAQSFSGNIEVDLSDYAFTKEQRSSIATLSESCRKIEKNRSDVFSCASTVSSVTAVE